MPSKIHKLFSLDNQLLFWFIVSLSLLPIWVTHYPPMVDLPQHAGQVNALQQIWQGNSEFTETFEINWFTPYLIGYLSVYTLALIVPITFAIKIVISIALGAIPLLSGILFREVGSDERWKWLVIPSIFSFAFYWGFLNYIVAIPFGLLFLIFTIRFSRNATVKNSVFIALYSVFLFFCHVIVLGFGSLLALAYLVGANYRDLKALVLRCLPYTAPLPLIAVWLVLTHHNEPGHSKILFRYDSERVTGVLHHISGIDYWYSPFLLLISGAVVICPFIFNAKVSRKVERWLPLLVGASVFLLFPSSAFGTALLYHRLGVFLVPLWLMVWDPPDNNSSKWHWLAIAVVVIWGATNTVRFVLFDIDAKDFDRIISVAEPNKRVLSMIVDKKSRYFRYPVYLHFSLWYQATRNGIVDSNFALYYPEMVRFRSDKQPAVGTRFVWKPARFSWDEHDGDSYDYFIVRANSEVGEQLFKERLDAVTLRAQSGSWWLYETKEKERQYGVRRSFR